jgi:hypothetical protein
MGFFPSPSPVPEPEVPEPEVPEPEVPEPEVPEPEPEVDDEDVPVQRAAALIEEALNASVKA